MFILGSLLAQGHLPKLGTTEPQEEPPADGSPAWKARRSGPSVGSPLAGYSGG